MSRYLAPPSAARQTGNPPSGLRGEIRQQRADDTPRGAADSHVEVLAQNPADRDGLGVVHVHRVVVRAVPEERGAAAGSYSGNESTSGAAADGDGTRDVDGDTADIGPVFTQMGSDAGKGSPGRHRCVRGAQLRSRLVGDLRSGAVLVHPGARRVLVLVGPAVLGVLGEDAAHRVESP